MESTASQVRVEQHIAASPESLYDMVSDVTSMGSWSPENRTCRWLRGANAAAPGARFQGSNRHGWRRWRTTCTVVAADRGRRFAFDVGFVGLPIAHWAYEFVPDGSGCRVVETWKDRRHGWMIKLTSVVMGIADRAGHNRDGMTTTLSRLRTAAEHATSPTP